MRSGKHPLLQVSRYSNWWLLPPPCQWALRQGFLWAAAASDSSPFRPALLLLCFPFKPLLPTTQANGRHCSLACTAIFSLYIVAHSSWSGTVSVHMHISGTATYASRAQEIQLDEQNRITCYANGILKAGNSINVSGSWLQHRWRRFHTYSSTTTYVHTICLLPLPGGCLWYVRSWSWDHSMWHHCTRNADLRM